MVESRKNIFLMVSKSKMEYVRIRNLMIVAKNRNVIYVNKENLNTPLNFIEDESGIKNLLFKSSSLATCELIVL